MLTGGKLAEAMQALLHTITPATTTTSQGGSSPLLLGLAVGLACGLLLLLLLLLPPSLRRRSGKQTTGAGGGKPTKPMPTLPGLPLLGATSEVLANMPRFLEFLHEKTLDPAFGGSDGLGTLLRCGGVWGVV